MKGLTLMPSDLAGRDRSSGRSLLSNYLPPCLESKLLAQHQPSAASSALLSLCPSLQPTQLSSTASARLLSSSAPASTSTSSSPLLSTQSRLLQTASAAARPGPLLRATLDTSGGALLRGFALLPTPSSCVPTPGREEEEEEGEEREEASSWGGGETFSQCSSTQEPSSVLETSTSDDDDDSDYDEVDADDITAESPVLDIEMANREQEQTLAIMPEEFPELQQEKDVEAELNDKKYLLLNAVFSSLLSKTTTQKRVGELEGVWPTIVTLATDISSVDPQFLLKDPSAKS
ncbi:bromodomain adjacent to zinc finger domain protein 2B-like [Gadus macrocephalus]|uniref:bromodomain adjacent to zinc finger domain protein 2B-like n=1 Tax=Gadus macrocephalus TaxID=80720 RepID=UPI0028CB3133|nr:bromodomain adjacent to zinc finger domain protein 2B-like [Gadus macrocephalus]